MTEQKDYMNIVRNVLKQWLIVLLVSIIATLTVGIGASRLYRPHFTTEALLVTYLKSGYGYAAGNANEASHMASTFNEIINSNFLQKEVSKAMGIKSLPGTISVENVQSTNLIYLRVSANTPQDAMTTINGVLDNYNDVSGNLFSSSVIQVIEAPAVPTTVSGQYNEPKLLLYTFVLSFMAMLALMFAYFYFRDDIKNESEIEVKLDATLFATIYHENKKKSFKLFGKRKSRGILVNDPITSFGYIETIQKICMKFEYMTQNSKAKTILITSVQENEGKSTVSANLALMLAKRGKKVVLVDCDLRKPATHKLFGLNYSGESKQFGAVLQGKARLGDALMAVPRVPNLHILAGNISYQNATALLSTQRAGKIFEFLPTKVDYVILDTPPLFLAADAEQLMKQADAGILVVRQNYSKVRDLNDAIDIFKSADCEMLGCILNDVEFNSPAASFSKTDNYYYRYGYGRNYYGKRNYSKDRYAKYKKTKME